MEREKLLVSLTGGDDQRLRPGKGAHDGKLLLPPLRSAW